MRVLMSCVASSRNVLSLPNCVGFILDLEEESKMMLEWLSERREEIGVESLSFYMGMRCRVPVFAIEQTLEAEGL